MRHVLLAVGLALATQLAAQAPNEPPAAKDVLGAALREKLPQVQDREAAPVAPHVQALLQGLARRQDNAPRGSVALPDDSAGSAQRIWARTKEEPDVWFRRSMELTKPAKSARVYFSCDNECTVFVNGLEAGSCAEHQDLTVVDLVAPPPKGKLTLAVHARNTGGPGALVLWFLWEDADGKHELVTDKEWRLSETEAAKWLEPAFDDSKWETATAEFSTEFGKNTYNGTPSKVNLVNQLTPAFGPIDQAVAALRSAKDRDAALKALEELDRAVVRAREHVWRMPAAAEKSPR